MSHRPALERQVENIAQRRQEAAKKKAEQMLSALRSQMAIAQDLLQRVKTGQCLSPEALHFDLGEPGGDTAMTGSWHGSQNRYALNCHCFLLIGL